MKYGIAPKPGMSFPWVGITLKTLLPELLKQL